MENINLEFLEDKARHAEKLGHEWAERNQISRRYDEGRKAFFAGIKNKVAQEKAQLNQKIVEAQIERIALAHPDYKDYIDQWVDAEKEAIKAKVSYESAKNLFEARRSYASLEKARMNLT